MKEKLPQQTNNKYQVVSGNNVSSQRKSRQLYCPIQGNIQRGFKYIRKHPSKLILWGHLALIPKVDKDMAKKEELLETVLIEHGYKFLDQILANQTHQRITMAIYHDQVSSSQRQDSKVQSQHAKVNNTVIHQQCFIWENTPGTDIWYSCKASIYTPISHVEKPGLSPSSSVSDLCSCLCVPWEAVDDGTSTWVPTCHKGELLDFSAPGFGLEQPCLLQTFENWTSWWKLNFSTCMSPSYSHKIKPNPHFKRFPHITRFPMVTL